VKESCRTYEGVMSHIWVSHVAHMKESCRTYEWVMSHIRMSHVAYMSESCRTYEGVMLHIWVSHVAYTSKLYRVSEWRHVSEMSYVTSLMSCCVKYTSRRHVIFSDAMSCQRCYVSSSEWVSHIWVSQIKPLIYANQITHVCTSNDSYVQIPVQYVQIPQNGKAGRAQFFSAQFPSFFPRLI